MGSETLQKRWESCMDRLRKLDYRATLNAIIEDGPQEGIDYESLGREQPQGEATREYDEEERKLEAMSSTAAQTEGGEKPREIFVGPPDRLETALDIMGVDPLSQGTFTCDICGNDVPHSHEPAEVETERYIRPAFKKTTVPRQAWAQLEAQGPYLEPLTDQLFKHFASGWVAAKRHYQIVEPSSPPATAGTAEDWQERWKKWPPGPSLKVRTLK